MTYVNSVADLMAPAARVVLYQLWEIKYFGPLGLANAQIQLARYLDKCGPGCREGDPVSAGWVGDVFYFSAAPGVVLYVPEKWLPKIVSDPERYPTLSRSLNSLEVEDVLERAAAVEHYGPQAERGYQTPRRILI